MRSELRHWGLVSRDDLFCYRFLATCSADTTVKIWSISQNYEFRQEKALVGHQRWVWDCAFSADSAYLVTGTHCLITFEDTALIIYVIQRPRITPRVSGKWPRARPFDSTTVIIKVRAIDSCFDRRHSPSFLNAAAVCCALHDGAS
jgi:WD40 repeat protein